MNRLKLYENYKLNENVSDVDIIKYHIQKLQNLNIYVDFDVRNGRIYLSNKGLNLLNSNNNHIGVEAIKSFLAGMVAGAELKA